VARAVIADRRRQASDGSFDLAGALSVTLGLLALVYGIVNAGANGWGDAGSLGPIGAGLVLLVAFVAIEGRLAVAPLVPLRVFSNRLLRASNIAVLVFSAALFPMWYFCSLYLQEVLHFDALEAGLSFLPMSLTIMAVGTQAGGIVARFGAGRVLAAGLSLMALGLLLFARMSVHGSYVGDFLAPGLIESVGIGLSVVPSTIAATATAAPHEAGLASGLVNTSRQMGGALGIALLVSISVLFSRHLVDSSFSAPVVALNDGFRLAFAIAAGFTLIGAAIALRYIPGDLRPGAPALAPVRDGSGVQAAGPSAGGPARDHAVAPPRDAEAPPPDAAPPPRDDPPPRDAAPTARDDLPRASGAGAPPGDAPARRAAEPPVPSPAPEPAASAPGAAPRPRGPAPRVVLTVTGGGTWALAPGATTLARRGGGRGRSV
jgi:hypothetical protein